MIKRYIECFLMSIVVLAYSCTVSIDGAPCNPELNNCPSGQYCSSDGICKRGSKEIEDINIVDTSTLDGLIYKDATENDVESPEDIVFADAEDIGLDAIRDGGCIDECQIDKCKDGKVLLVCKDWDQDGCKEYKEVDCAGNSYCANNICICQNPYKDCNNDMSDGCETNTDTDPTRCGSCSNNCGENSKCNNGNCDCLIEFENCNGKWTDGCEINISNDAKNCGGCNKPCGYKSYCSNYNCVCESGYADCNKNVAGCETNLNLVESCGTNCDNIVNCHQNSKCNSGVCECIQGFGNCNNDWGDGCETDVNNDLNHCGECNKICTPQNVNQKICSNGKCSYDMCLDFFLDKNLNLEDGCEYWTNYPKRYDNQNSKDEPVFILPDSEDIIIGGNTINNQLWLLKVDRYGEILWQKKIQLYGAAKLKRGIKIINDQGIIEGFLLVGTLQNADRIDIFAMKIDGKGNVLFAKNYFRQNVVNKFDVMDAVYIAHKKRFILVGSSEGTPLFLSIKEDGTLDFIKYYMEKGAVDLPIGVFTSVKTHLDTEAVYVTGIYSRSSIKNGLFVIKIDIDGTIINYKRISSTVDLAGLDMVPAFSLISSENFIIVGDAGIRGLNGSGLILEYDFLNEKIVSQYIFMGKDASSSNVGLSFKSISINSNNDTYIVGGTAFFKDNVSITPQPLILTADQNSSITNIKTVRADGGEGLVDMFFNNNSLFFISPTYVNSVDMLVVRLSSNLEVEKANCNKSFLSLLNFASSSLINPSLSDDSIIIQDYDNIKFQDSLNSINNVNGIAYNVCSKP